MKPFSFWITVIYVRPDSVGCQTYYLRNLSLFYLRFIL